MARFGNGWFGIGHSLETIQPVLKQLREIVRAEGRDPQELEVITAAEVSSRDELLRWEELGVTRLVVCPWPFRPSPCTSHLPIQLRCSCAI